jgi:chromosomal replication initiator protein
VENSVDVTVCWGKSLRILEHELNSVAYTTWVLPLKPVRVTGEVFFLLAPDDTTKQTVEHRYIKAIISAVQTAANRDLSVSVQLPADLAHGFDATQNIYRSSLKSKYVFENFVKGKGNELAFAASMAVAESPGETTYNPLFLYGGVGLGKTHLMHSLGNFILTVEPCTKVLYTSAENLMNEFINSIRERKNQEFRDKYRTVDVLLVDDIQFLLDKEGTQEEFFHTFNELYFANKQIVISSDKPPAELKTLEERLRSRFGSGLLVDITAPDFETRTAILEKKAELDNIKIPSDIIRLIAKSISSNIRDLESALNKISAHAKLTNTEITVALAERTLKEINNSPDKHEINIEYIQDVVSAHFGITSEELRSRRRSANITAARHVAMYLTRKILDAPLIKIGDVFGGRDHSTVMYACEKIASDIDQKPQTRQAVITLEAKIRGE